MTTCHNLIILSSTNYSILQQYKNTETRQKKSEIDQNGGFLET